jgi:hypothetical protein
MLVAMSCVESVLRLCIFRAKTGLDAEKLHFLFLGFDKFGSCLEVLSRSFPLFLNAPVELIPTSDNTIFFLNLICYPFVE